MPTNSEMELFMHRKVYDTLMNETTLTMEQAVHVVETMQNKGVIFTHLDFAPQHDVEEWQLAVENERLHQVEKGYTIDHDRKQGLLHLITNALYYADLGQHVQSTAIVLAAYQLLLTDGTRQSNLVDHARRELEAIGEEEAVIKDYLKVIQAFADQGHSGGSASVFVPNINQLLQFKNLGPLTTDPREWFYHGRDRWDGENGIWQNTRNSEAFSNDGGKTYYLLSETKSGRKKKKMHKSESISAVSPNPIRHRRKGR